MKKRTRSEAGLRRAKKAESAWISYVMLTGFMLILGVIVYNWLVGYVKYSGKDVIKTVTRYSDCDYISVNIDDSCQPVSNPQRLYINITNKNNLRVDAFTFNIFGDSTNIENVEQNITIKPGKQKEVLLFTNITNATLVQIVPIMYKEAKDELIVIRCTDKKVSSKVSVCQ